MINTVSSAAASPEGSQRPSSTIANLVSLALVIHLFCAGVALYSSQSPASPGDGNKLIQRLARVLRPYSQLLNYESSGTFFLTHATFDDDDHRIEYLPEGKVGTNEADWVLLRSGMRGTDRYFRYQRLADMLAYFGSGQDDNTSSLLAAGVGTYVVRQKNEPVRFVRARRHLPQEMADVAGGTSARQDPDNAAEFLREVYRAQIIAVDGEPISIQKVEEAGQVAPVKRGASP